MPTLFPAGNDTFTEPSVPESTSLSSAGTGTRNHLEHHRDVGDAVEALERLVALLDHDHSGTGGRPTAKLKQANTHESADTDVAATSLHHTLGPGAFQAAPGNHKHQATDILGQAMVLCTSTTRPSSPVLGMMIYETDRHRVYVWDQFPSNTTGPCWTLLPIASRPICRLLLGTPQKIYRESQGGSVLEWRVEQEDTFGMFNPVASMTNVIIPESGLYDINASVSWTNTDFFADRAQIGLLLNGSDTTRKQRQYVGGRGIFNPGYPQTVAVSAKVRYNQGDILGVKATHNGNDFQFTYSSTTGSDKQDSFLDIAYLSP